MSYSKHLLLSGVMCLFINSQTSATGLTIGPHSLQNNTGQTTKEELNSVRNALAIAQNANDNKTNLILLITTGLVISKVGIGVLMHRSRKLNRQLKQREKVLESMNTSKNELFTVVGHHLKDSIDNVSSLLNILKNETSGEAERSFIVNTLSENASASKETLEKLLEWGRCQIEGISVRPTVFGVNQIIEDRMKVLRVPANYKHVSIVSNVPIYTKIHADRDHFDFIIQCLLNNAVKYSKSNGLVEVNAERAGDGFILFSIKDNSIGFDPQGEDGFKMYEEHILHNANEVSGSLGLMLCIEFAERNGGAMWVQSEKGKGATFYFSLKEVAPF